MSLLSSFTKKSKLSATIKLTQQARNNEGNTADHLFKSAYTGYAEVLLDDPIRADALYNWGFALLHQAKTKESGQAVDIYQDAINKFAFCLLINPNYLGAAINGGVAYMDLARLQGVPPSDRLYTFAQQQFEAANAIQTGTASYNLACIHALRDDFAACRKALENAYERGSLPDATDILNDPDLDKAKGQNWFLAFIGPLMAKVEVEADAGAEPTATQADETSFPESAATANDAEADAVAVAPTAAQADEAVSTEGAAAANDIEADTVADLTATPQADETATPSPEGDADTNVETDAVAEPTVTQVDETTGTVAVAKKKRPNADK